MSETRPIILVVTGDQRFRLDLIDALDKEYGVQIISPERDVNLALNTLPVATIVLDLDGEDSKHSFRGLSLLEVANKSTPPIPVIAISNGLDHSAKLEFADLGGYGLLDKPVKPEELQVMLRQTVGLWRLRKERSKHANFDYGVGFSRLLGTSLAMERVISQARAVAKTNATILLTGENGTGKEILAYAIHEESARRGAPFVAINCAAVPETLLESELFGYERGAFTGATSTRKGRFELADGGTLFLDEIGDLPHYSQVKLLRVLQERKFERLGGTSTVTVDIRLIAASNQDLQQEVAVGRFREDLFYRLYVIPLRLPPLRERREDIPILATYFAAEAARKHGRPVPVLDPALLDALAEYDWPGNVRELENLIERLVVLTAGARLTAEHLPEKVLGSQDNAGYEEKLFDAIESFRTRRVHEALNAEGGDAAAAAKRLGISRAYLYRLLKAR